ncbi:SDR family oxidoreductase [Nocardioides anomalus]|uniref:SDR family oxidoreductase n=1 Tax=Nocardioides anomalus TaxID=2712223 RepID=A0A6G6WJR5_9ACTN|nr:SDR family oxidoreductase [Nocardioides anomalus]QIG45484.1 SDR family oxidoreductase [Nocardioides anomalus]
MHVFVTGASGWIGSATVRELVSAGHTVTGLARSEESAARVETLGATVLRGDLGDTGLLAEAARGADGVVHLGYHHDFSQMDRAADLDRAACEAMGAELEGKPFVFASGLVGVRSEDDRPSTGAHPRVANSAATLALAERGVRTVAARFAPTVHGQGDHGFVAELVRVARERGVASYAGDGSNPWAAVHVSDAARLVRLALEEAPAGSAVHAVAEEGVATRDIAEAIGRGLGLPTRSIAADDAMAEMGWIGPFFAMDLGATSAQTRMSLGWEPTGPSLLEDLPHYTA